uniref:Uncharacterized protein n=1 Tax=Arundo donax TaxID=35708 RepID=A0A0A9HJG8_ARUDO
MYPQNYPSKLEKVRQSDHKSCESRVDQIRVYKNKDYLQ